MIRASLHLGDKPEATHRILATSTCVVEIEGEVDVFAHSPAQLEAIRDAFDAAAWALRNSLKRAA